MFNVVLVEPEIPPNTGNVGRLCLATQSTLHLVGPLGFSIEDRDLKRAGLDYWKEVDVQRWKTLEELQSQNGGARFFYLTTKARHRYFDEHFQSGDFFIFGRETKGLPEKVLAENAERCLTIPMHGTRSLNLATAVAIVLFEAIRQQRC